MTLKTKRYAILAELKVMSNKDPATGYGTIYRIINTAETAEEQPILKITETDIESGQTGILADKLPLYRDTIIDFIQNIFADNIKSHLRVVIHDSV